MSSRGASVNQNQAPQDRIFTSVGQNQETEGQRRCRLACVPITVFCATLSLIVYVAIMYGAGIYD